MNRPTKVSGHVSFNDDSIEMNSFIKALSGIRAKGVRPQLIGSIIKDYASKWLPELVSSGEHSGKKGAEESESPDTLTATWMRKRFCVETLIGVLPQEKDSISCDFLLRLLRVANMVRVEMGYIAELERRVMWQLEGASLKELMIPSFSHTCPTLLDVGLVVRLVKGFLNLDEAFKTGAALVKVAKLVDCYLGEASIDSNLSVAEFIALAGPLPGHARATDDRLYKAIDTFLRAHPGVSKQEKKILCSLIDSRKLSHEASLHATQNEQLPVRVVMQILFSEQSKLQRQFDWSGSLSGRRTPSYLDESKCEIARQVEIKKLRDNVVRLEGHCATMQGHIEKILEEKSFSKWKKLGKAVLRSVAGGKERNEVDGDFGRHTPAVNAKTKSIRAKTPNRQWRKSVS